MSIQVKQRKPPPLERRPTLMLKDFLGEDFSSCSSSGFRSFPRRVPNVPIRKLVEADLKPQNPKKLFKSRSKATSTTMSALQRASKVVLNVVKHFNFSSGKTSLTLSPLPRSFSRKLLRSFSRKSDKQKNEINVVVKVKDIIRWKSFRDLIEEKQKTADNNYSLSSPVYTTTTNTITTTTTNSSWSDSDFTSEYRHSSSGSSDFSNDENCKKKNITTTTTNNHKIKPNVVVGDSSLEKVESHNEKDQLSPVSVLDCPFDEDEESSPSFNSSLEKMERTKHKLTQKIRRFESLTKLEPINLEKRIESMEQDDSLDCQSDSYSLLVNNDSDEDQEHEDDDSIKTEAKARELLKLIKQETSISEESRKWNVDNLLVDFFRDEIMENNLIKKPTKDDDDNEYDNALLKGARDWMTGNCRPLDWGVEESRGTHVKDMERGGRWKTFEEEQSDIGLELEITVLDSLMDELVLDLVS
ncbi:hypothetical protein GIB67_019234 [Kingdonia uniflora]|uniref:DUF4378 domain-containing protein n=1 Tax=Kingdonia uniflora TaxID=39325 RepID=A0A7J7MZV5_9MAGN|nr:hypothetical protein GIB67_019234 [Kingdonia uniflora]